MEEYSTKLHVGTTKLFFYQHNLNRNRTKNGRKYQRQKLIFIKLISEPKTLILSEENWTDYKERNTTATTGK